MVQSDHNKQPHDARHIPYKEKKLVNTKAMKQKSASIDPPSFAFYFFKHGPPLPKQFLKKIIGKPLLNF